MKVKVTRFIEEIVELPNEMFVKTGKETKWDSPYEPANCEKLEKYMEDNCISCIEDLNNKTIAEL